MVLLVLHSPEMLESRGRVSSNGSQLFLHRQSLWPSCCLLRSVSRVTRTAEASSSQGHIWSSGFVNCAWDQMASSSSADVPIKGTPSWMVIPWVLVVVGSLLPFDVYLKEGKMSGFEEESPRILAGFSVALSSDSSMSSSRVLAGSKATCPVWRRAHERPPEACMSLPGLGEVP